MNKHAFLAILIASYLATIFPFTDYMRNKPFMEKLGYTPRADVLRFIVADQKLIIASALVMKTLFYYGGLVEKAAAKVVAPPDYFAIYKTIETAVKLDPYNMDAYYFAQAVMVWEVGRTREANALLEYGMKYRDWDFYLPFFAGFNYAYFLKDYQKAATSYQRAAELSGVDLYANLAGRYMYEAGQTDLALAYLSAMEKGARNASIRKSFQIRIAALKEVKRIETALALYRKDSGNAQVTVEDLVQRGYLKDPPVDPYGGRFYIDEQGQVRSTSKFAFDVTKSDELQR